MWGEGQSCLGSLLLRRHAIRLRALQDLRSCRGHLRSSKAASAAQAAVWPAPQHGPMSATVLRLMRCRRQKKQACPVDGGLRKGNLRVSHALMHTAALRRARHL